MSCGRLLLLALVVYCLPAFTQDHSPITGKADGDVSAHFQLPPAATPSEPWRILPRPGSDKDKSLLSITPEMGPEGIIVTPGGPLAAEATCYAIRSYVVARDSKDADSVHPVRYSTCMPAGRYRLKSADDHVLKR